MPTLRINEITYHYRRQGQGPALVLLHGFTGSSSNWLPLMDRLAPEFDVVALDLLGHGRTDMPEKAARYAMELAAQDVVAAIETLEMSPAHLLGYSMGGRLALYLARYYSFHFLSLQMESGSPGLASEKERAERQEKDNRLAHSIERDGIEAFVKKWETLPLFASQLALPKDVRNTLHEQRLRNRPVGLANSLRGMGTGVQPSLWEELPRIAMPVHLICGELDRKFVEINQRMVRSLPNASLTVVPGARHTVHLEKPDQFAPLVQQFTNRAEYRSQT